MDTQPPLQREGEAGIETAGDSAGSSSEPRENQGFLYFFRYVLATAAAREERIRTWEH